MLTAPTLDKLQSLKLDAMAHAWTEQQQHAELTSLGFDERFGLLVDAEWLARDKIMFPAVSAATIETRTAAEPLRMSIVPPFDSFWLRGGRGKGPGGRRNPRFVDDLVRTPASASTLSRHHELVSGLASDLAPLVCAGCAGLRRLRIVGTATVALVGFFSSGPHLVVKAKWHVTASLTVGPTLLRAYRIGGALIFSPFALAICWDRRYERRQPGYGVRARSAPSLDVISAPLLSSITWIWSAVP